MFLHEIVKIGEIMDMKAADITTRTKLEDFIDQNRFVISNPTYRLAPLAIGVEDPVIFIFYRPDGMYSFKAVLEERFVRNTALFCVFRIITEVEKKQRRFSYRLPVVLNVTLYQAGANGEAQKELIQAKLLNLSEDGALLRCLQPLTEGTPLSIKIMLDRRELLTICAKVLRCEPPDSKKDPCVIAVQFVDCSPGEQACIRKYVFSQQIIQRKRMQ
ncbi:MAG: flagellar brake protein [Christensenellales bacterium]